MKYAPLPTAISLSWLSKDNLKKGAFVEDIQTFVSKRHWKINTNVCSYLCTALVWKTKIYQKYTAHAWMIQKSEIKCS